MFTEADPETGDDFLANLNPDSLKVVQAVIEPALAQAKPEDRFQFEREGYFVADQYDHTPEKPVFNRVLDLKTASSLRKSKRLIISYFFIRQQHVVSR